jgi:hypothetical protein
MVQSNAMCLLGETMNEQIEMNFDAKRNHNYLNVSAAYTKPKFDGSDFSPKLDQERLTGQLKRIYDVMSDGKARTLDEISKLAFAPHASVSANLRNLRKVRFGSYTILKERAGDPTNGLFVYRMVAK